MGKNKATSKKGTVYTQVNDSTYKWMVPGSYQYGVIHTNPVTGAWGTYHEYRGAGVAPEEMKLSEEYLQSHLNNIKNGDFQYYPDWTDDVKKYWNQATTWAKNKWNALFDKNGGPINYLNLF